MEKTIGSITMSDPEQSLEERGGLPVIPTVFSLSTSEGTREQGMEIEHVSTITKDSDPFDPKVKLTGKDLQIKKEMVDEDLHPGDPGYYSRLQYIYQNWKKAERTVENTRNTTHYVANLQKCHSIGQILENMKMAYAEHAKHVGKTLPKDWDTAGLEKPILPRGARGMKIPVEQDPDYHPEPISHLKPNDMGVKEIEKCIAQFEKEIQELNKICEKGTAKEYTKAKMERRNRLENKLAEFEIEKEDRIARRGGSKRSMEQEEKEDPRGPPKSRGQLESPWDRPKPTKGTYPKVGPKGPGDLNLEGDWEGPIELFEFEDIEEGWTNCTTGYYWHSVLGGGICQYSNEWYRNWEFDYQPPDEEVVPEEPEEEIPEVSQGPPEGEEEIVKQTEDTGGEGPLTLGLTPSQQGEPVQSKTSSASVQVDPQDGPGSSLLTKNPLAPLSPEESKTRDNNIAHIKHLKEAMKKGLEKWDELIRKTKDPLDQVGMKIDRDRLDDWIADINMVLDAVRISPVYIPIVKETWVRAAKQKPTPTLENPDEPSPQPNKPKGSEPIKKPVARKSGGKGSRKEDKDNGKKGEPQPQKKSPEDQTGEGPEDEPLPPGPEPDDPEDPLGIKPKPRRTDPKLKLKPKGAKSDEPVPKKPKHTTGSTSEDPKTWYKTGVAYDTKRTGPAATPPEGLLNVTRKRKAGCQPKTSGETSTNKRKRTTPAKWMPYTQPRTTYIMGNKITPAWGLTHRNDMDQAENWSIPRYSPPKLTEKQETAQQEAHKDKKKYKRYKPGQLALKEIRYYQKKVGFIIPISAIRRLCLEIGYECKKKISFKMHAYRLLQEAAEWYLVRVFKDTNLLAIHAKRVTICP